LSLSVRAIVHDVIRGRRDLRDGVVEALSEEARADILRKHRLVPLLHYHYDLPIDLPGIDGHELERNQFLHRSAQKFIAEHANWDGVVVKGCSTSRLYDNPLSRKVFDVDILTTKQNAVEYFQRLRGEGFDVVEEAGNVKLEEEHGKVSDAEARDALMLKLVYFHEMPPLRKDRDVIIDLNFRVAYRGSVEYRKIFAIDAIEEYFANEVAGIRGLNIGFPRASVDLLYLVVHYAAEMFLFEFEGLRPGVPDLRLKKLLDIAMYFTKNVVDVDDFVATAEAASADVICGYFFDIMADLFEIAEMAAIASRFRTRSEPYHNAYMTKGGTLVRWDAPPSVRVERVRSA
jgi:putative nucleotidyltransferase-like protein